MAGIEGLGHVGIYARDLMKLRDFYTRVLELKIADEELEQRGIVFLSANPDDEHHELVLMKGRDVPIGAKLVQQISFKVGSPDDIREYYHRLVAEKAKIERFVSHGNALGLYFLDPEGNQVEVYYKTGFPVPQPHGDPLSIEQSTEEWIALARAAIPAGTG